MLFFEQAKVETILNYAYKFALVDAFAELIPEVNDDRRNELNHSDIESKITIHLFDFPVEDQLALTRLDPNNDHNNKFEPNRDLINNPEPVSVLNPEPNRDYDNEYSIL